MKVENFKLAKWKGCEIMAKFKPRVAIDFDGVINSYTSGWKGEANIPDPPVPGIKEAIQALLNAGYEVVVYSTRCIGTAGKKAVENYLAKYGIVVSYTTGDKPPAICYIDDRAICFDGDSAALLDKVKNFKPWYQKGV